MFNPCKNLIHDASAFPTCKLVFCSDGTPTWERRDVDGKRRLCQFCRLRGRLNDAEACMSDHLAKCTDYQPVQVEGKNGLEITQPTPSGE